MDTYNTERPHSALDRFNSAGTFFYHCNIHPSMTARVTVTGT